MPNVPESKSKSKTDHAWYDVADLIAGIQATPTQKMYLTLVWRHRNARKGYAWASEESLADEMGTSVSTVERSVAWAKKLGAVGVRRVRTGKNPKDQYNEYWLNVENLKKLQRPARNPIPEPGGGDPEHPASMTGDAPEHHSPVTDDVKGEHPASSTRNTRHSEAEHPSNGDRTPSTNDGIGFKVLQVLSNSKKSSSVPSGRVEARSPEPAAASSSTNGQPKPDDDVLFQKAKTNFVRKHHGEHLDTDLAEACELWRDRHDQDRPKDPIRNWTAFFEDCHRKSGIDDWKQVRQRLAEATKNLAEATKKRYLESPEAKAKLQKLWSAAKERNWLRNEFVSCLYHDFQVRDYAAALLSDLDYAAALTCFQGLPPRACKEPGCGALEDCEHKAAFRARVEADGRDILEQMARAEEQSRQEVKARRAARLAEEIRKHDEQTQQFGWIHEIMTTGTANGWNEEQINSLLFGGYGLFGSDRPLQQYEYESFLERVKHPPYPVSANNVSHEVRIGLVN